MDIQVLRRSYDVVVVGARCAGAATALLLARAGLRVIAIDRGTYGADTVSTHALMRGGVVQLTKWGLMGSLRAAGTPAIRRTVFHYGDHEIEIPIAPRYGVDALYAPRRTVLDALLVDEARRSGATVAYGVRLVRLVRTPAGRVAGVVIDDPATGEHEVRADMVVGADGWRSTVARAVGATTYRRGRASTGTLYGYWRGVDVDASHWFYRPGVSVGAIPTNDGLTCVFATMPTSRFTRDVARDVGGAHRTSLDAVSAPLADRVARGELVGRLRVFPGAAGGFRQCWGPGWALVGDAGLFKDPITAHGITDALRDAELLADAIVDGTDRALADYQAARDDLAGPVFDATEVVASFDWDLGTLEDIHRRLSTAMSREAEAIARRGSGVPTLP